MGYEKNTTPNLDELATDGLTFENAIAPGPRTWVSMPAIFTGQHPIIEDEQLGLQSRGDEMRRHLGVRETIAEQFSRAGYETAGFTPNGYTSRYFGFDEGFDYFQDFLEEESRPDPNRRLPTALTGLWKLLRHEEKFKPWESYYEEIIDWIDGAAEPYFIWIMLMDTHAPYFAGRNHRQDNSALQMYRANWNYWRHNFSDITDRFHEVLIGAYDDSIRYADAFLERLQRDATETDPVLVIHADHGEKFGEHGAYGHGKTLYQEDVHVPLVIANAGASGQVSRPVSLQNLKQILGRIRKNRKGINRERIIGALDKPVLSRARDYHSIMVQSGQLKLIKHLTSEVELYDIKHDPEEQTNLRDEKPEVVDQLSAYVRRHIISQTEKQTLAQQSQPIVKGDSL